MSQKHDLIDKPIPFLCGGIFFTLLLHAKTSTKPNQMICFNKLMITIDPYFKPIEELTNKSFVTQFRKCEINESKHTGFGDVAIIDSFNKRIENNYEKVMNDFAETIDSIITNTEKKKWFISALVELVSKDKTIDENEEFRVGKYLSTMKKKEIMTETQFSYYDFVLGMWLFVFSQDQRKRPEKWGKDTFVKWTNKSQSTGEFVLCCKIGLSGMDSILIDFDISNGEMNSDMQDQKSIEFPVENAIRCGYNDPDETAFENDVHNRIKKYLHNAKRARSKIVTFLFRNEEKFYNFFVCSNLMGSFECKTNGAYKIEHRIIENANISKISKEKRRVIIEGSAGLGKTMMMNHLFLDSIINYNSYKQIPIFVTLRDYDCSLTLLDFVFSEFQRYNAELTINDLRLFLSTGSMVLLMDGLDEITGNTRSDFDKQLERMMDLYNECLYIISMRPGDKTLFLGKFHKYNLQYFTREQSFELISRIGNNYLSDKLKKQFFDDIANNRFDLSEYEYRVFFGTPLFLCITINTYRYNMDIPKKRHEFYEKAYDAVCEGHDRIKELRRDFYTKLSSADFKKFFSEFCVRTYGDSKYSFEEYELKQYVEDIEKAYNYKFSYIDFIKDVVERVCLMFVDGGKYHFVHRSFQEYFTADFFSKQPEDTFDFIFHEFVIGKEKENTEDVMVEMLYEMNEYLAEKYIFIPYLEFVHCMDSDKDYYEFLKYNYGTIDSLWDEDYKVVYNYSAPKCRMVKLICEINNISISNDTTNDFAHDKGSLSHSKRSINLGSAGAIFELHKSEVSIPEDVFTNNITNRFYLCHINLESGCVDRNKVDGEVLELINRNDFPTKIQFHELVKLHKELKEKYSKKKDLDSHNKYEIFRR